MNNKIKIGILAAIGIVAVVTLVLSRDNSSQNNGFQDGVPISLKEEDFSYDDATDAYKKAKESGEFQDSSKGNNNHYSSEDDPRIQKLQEQIDIMQDRNGQNVDTGNSTPSAQPVERPLTAAEKEALRRAELLRAREERLARSQDYSAPTVAEPVDTSAMNFLEFQAAIYRDQFILPGDRVTLILTQPITYKGNVFEKNTLIYATANIQGSRVLLNTTNISKVPVVLIAKDIKDDDPGMYNERAGELWGEFAVNMQTTGVDEAAEEIAQKANIPLGRSAIRAFTQFFRKKKYSDKEKIPLYHNDKLILTTPTQ